LWMGDMRSDRRKISGFVVTYNSESLVETCLRSLRFVDELVVVDKTSTDGTVDIAKEYADKVVVVPWTPTADDTREYALGLCSHDAIVYLDDDECLSCDAIRFILEEAASPSAEVYSLPVRTYYLGHFDKHRRDWPDYKERFFLRGAVEFPAVIHGCVAVKSTKRRVIPADSSVCIHHMSSPSVSNWIEKANRYTSQPLRASWFDKSTSLSMHFVQRQIEYWTHGLDTAEDNYATAYALMRVAYDLIDRLKLWETENGLDGKKAFADLCAQLQHEYDALEASRGRPRHVSTWQDTKLFVDEGSGLLRHGSAAPAGSVVVERDGTAASLVQLAEGPGTGAGLVHSKYELVEVSTPWWDGFGLKRDGLYLCAEPDGSITLSRTDLSAWETFRMQ
jgi:glycosyltransferase involved in cell wall biosynthesis